MASTTRRRIAGLAGAIALSSGLMHGPAPAGASTGTNWVVAQITVAEATNQLSGGITFTGTYDGTERVVAGFASRLSTTLWTKDSNYAFDSGTGPTDVATTGELGGQSLTVEPGDGASFDGSYSISFGGFDFAPGDTVDLLFYLTGTSLTDITASATGTTGAVPVTITTGSGAANVAMASPTTGGSGVTAGSVAGGSTANTVTTTAGLVGARVARCAVAACTFGVSGPGTTTNAIEASTVTDVYTTGEPFFAGPAGDWTFRFTGVGSSPVMVAYAPIGDLWSLFG